jgi:hypothetical protein
MRDKQLAVVGAQHARRAVVWRAAPGQHAWHRSAHLALSCRFFVGARDTCRAAFWRVVPGEDSWRRAVHSGITIHGACNASHSSPLGIPKSLQITRHTMPSNFSRNSMKTKDRAPRKVTHFFNLAPSAFFAIQGSRR